jgi:hypothetical protein
VTVVFGAVFAVIGLVLLAWVCWIRQTGLRAQGVVVSSGGKWISGTGDGTDPGGMSFRPVVQFTTLGGDTVEFRAKIGGPVRCKPGRLVPVCYRASRPQTAVINTFSQAWLPPLGVLMIGMVGVAMGF